MAHVSKPLGIAAGYGEAVQQGRFIALAAIDHVKAVFFVILEIGSIVAVEITTQNCLISHPVALGSLGLMSGKAAEERDAVHEPEREAPLANSGIGHV